MVVRVCTWRRTTGMVARKARMVTTAYMFWGPVGVYGVWNGGTVSEVTGVKARQMGQSSRQGREQASERVLRQGGTDGRVHAPSFLAQGSLLVFFATTFLNAAACGQVHGGGWRG